LREWLGIESLTSRSCDNARRITDLEKLSMMATDMCIKDESVVIVATRVGGRDRVKAHDPRFNLQEDNYILDESLGESPISVCTYGTSSMKENWRRIQLLRNP
jgi:hypothetical protein